MPLRNLGPTWPRHRAKNYIGLHYVGMQLSRAEFKVI